MCAIAGILDLEKGRRPDSEELANMLGALHHRGPDESGIYLDDRVALGHNRLSIIGISGGAQPIHNEDQTLWIVFNGEIFNYLELKGDLLRRGHRFYTPTDTEVIVHLFEEKGEECLKDMNGQFALAIWDKRKQELFLARDRLGILPLHYLAHRGRFAFASEIKALFALAEIPREMDPIAMEQIFTFWTTLNGRTSFRDVFEIPPGNYLKIKEGGVAVKRYWQIPCASPVEALQWPEQKICERLEELVIDSVRIRLRADVKVGCYISGGFDSSAIAAVVKKRFNNELRTFGIQFEEAAFDESEFQDLIVSHLATDHSFIVAKNQELHDCFAEVVRHCEKSLLRTAPLPLYLLSDIVHREGYKVVLTGEGADEAFCGYNIFKEAKIREFCAKRPDSKWRPLLFRTIYPYVFKDERLKKMASAFFTKGIDRKDDPLYSHLVRWENTGRTKIFFSDALKDAIGDYSGYEEIREGLPPDFDRLDVVTKAQYLEMSVFMSNYLLSTQGDRVAMAHSLELRPPFLDHRIIEFACRVPAGLKMRGLHEKYILKQAFKKILPEPILRRPKQPYRAPIAPMVLSGDMWQEVLSDSSVERAGLFHKARVRSLAAKLGSLKKLGEIDSMALAGILSSQLLYDQFVSGSGICVRQKVSPALVFDYRTGSDQDKIHSGVARS
ncbi:MAG: asparagine synthase (glutamine-hydrolyzing) [Syntrophobacteraceae bacterium]|nr:asparagine synthase (glutamine-hydrolyzing) [Syntrophobacteraceae bacterium]